MIRFRRKAVYDTEQETQDAELAYFLVEQVGKSSSLKKTQREGVLWNEGEFSLVIMQGTRPDLVKMAKEKKKDFQGNTWL